MTVSSSLARQAYATNGTTGPFTVPFYFIADSHLSVYWADEDGVETLLTLTTHYTVIGAGDPGGGDITLVTGYPSGGTITIVRNIPLTQLTDYLTADAFPADSHEQALDLVVMALQQFAEQIGRVLIVPVSNGAVSELPLPEAASVIGWDADGEEIRNYLLADLDGYAWSEVVESIWVPAASMTARLTNGPSPGAVELSTNKVMLVTYDFSPTTAEYVQFDIGAPPSWDEGTFTFVAVHSHAAATTYGVVYKMRMRSVVDGDLLDQAFGTAQSVTDTGGTTDKQYTSPESAAITPAGTPGDLTKIKCELYRDPDEAADTLDVDSRLEGVWVFFTRNSASDA